MRTTLAERIATLRALRAALRLLGLLVHCLEGFVEQLAVVVDVGKVLSLDCILEGCNVLLYILLYIGGHFVAVVLEELLGLEAECIGVVDLVNALLLRLVGCLVGLGFVAHPLDFLVGEA